MTTDYTKELEEQNESLKKLLAVEQRCKEYWKNKVERYFDISIEYRENLSHIFDSPAEFTEGIKAYSLFEISNVRPAVGNYSCESITINRMSGNICAWTINLYRSIGKLWALGGCIGSSGEFNIRKTKNWMSYDEMMTDVKKYIETKEYL